MLRLQETARLNQQTAFQRTSLSEILLSGPLALIFNAHFQNLWCFFQGPLKIAASPLAWKWAISGINNYQPHQLTTLSGTQGGTLI